MPPGADYTRVVRLFDCDNDGDLDLIVGNTGQSRLHVNDGTGRFTEVTATALPPGGNGTRDIAVGDVDGDGDLDLVLANDSGRNELWLNGGLGTFVPAPAQLPIDVQVTEAVALVDLDGDGALDLIVGNANATGVDPRSWVHRNDGSGRFLSPPISLGSTDVQAIACGDIDGDGDMDFVLGGRDVPVRLFENAGGGFFVSQAGTMPTDLRRSHRLVLADLDGDGDLDLFEGDDNEDRVLFSLHRHLNCDRLLIPGGSTTFTVDATPTSPASAPAAALILGFPAAPSPTAFGIARLDLATAVLATFLVLPSHRPRADWSLTVPPGSALLGLQIGAQALVTGGNGSPWLLSGLMAGTVRQ
ncbi:MAG: VCBS repeat-containing protein, partial [Planctomycetes bacterium]|nr:VCBS repeat-containing protein [Planctomycetota bacterium]